MEGRHGRGKDAWTTSGHRRLVCARSRALPARQPPPCPAARGRRVAAALPGLAVAALPGRSAPPPFLARTRPPLQPPSPGPVSSPRFGAGPTTFASMCARFAAAAISCSKREGELGERHELEEENEDWGRRDGSAIG